MKSILIVDDDKNYRDQMAQIFIEAGYSVTATSSVATAIYGIMRKVVQVVVLGAECDETTSTNLIPIMKRCNSRLPIILIAAEVSLGLLRKLRCEGIFYHALKPVDDQDREELRQVVNCAFQTLRAT